jgi:hypothetical protein
MPANNNPFAPKQYQKQYPTQPRRMGFQDVDKEVTATRGVKIKSKASEQAEEEKRAREEYLRSFDERAEQTVKHHNEQGGRAMEAITRFLKMSEDKTLAQNRGTIANDVEREVRQELLQLALDMNNDETEDDNGKGSVVVLSVVTKILMLYRDRMNEMEYEMHQLKRELAKNNSSSPPQQGL